MQVNDINKNNLINGRIIFYLLCALPISLIYVTEITPKNIRGRATIFLSLFYFGGKCYFVSQAKFVTTC